MTIYRNKDRDRCLEKTKYNIMAAEQSEKPLDTKTRDALTEGLIDLLKPSVEEIDDRVRTVRYSICSVIHPRCILKKGRGKDTTKTAKSFFLHVFIIMLMLRHCLL